MTTKKLARRTDKYGRELFIINGRVAAMTKDAKVVWWRQNRPTPATMPIRLANPSLIAVVTLLTAWPVYAVGNLLMNPAPENTGWGIFIIGLGVFVLALVAAVAVIGWHLSPLSTRDVVIGELAEPLPAKHPIRRVLATRDEFIDHVLPQLLARAPGDVAGYDLIEPALQAWTTATANNDHATKQELFNLAKAWPATDEDVTKAHHLITKLATLPRGPAGTAVPHTKQT